MGRIVFFLLILTFTAVPKGAMAQWQQREFVIGTFADPNLSVPANWDKDIASFTRAKEAHFNLLSGTQFYTGARDFSMMERVLKVAKAVGMKLLVIDSRMLVTEDTFSVRTADLLLSYFKSADIPETLYGYNFGGEFPASKAHQIRKWAGYFKSKHPGKLAYTYLLPRYGFDTDKAYEQYLDAYLKSKPGSGNLDVVSFDFYPFVGGNKIRDSYFSNLNLIAGKAGKKPFWIYVLSTPHSSYTDPDEYQLMFMCFAPITYGAKGLIYFTYQTLPDWAGKYGNALIGRDGNPTPKYAIAKKINRYIHDIVGPIVMTATLVNTSHSLSSEAEADKKGAVLTRENSYISSINTRDLLVGIFKARTPKTYYYFIVNKSEKPLGNASITLNYQIGNQYFISPSVANYNLNNKFAEIRPVITGKKAVLTAALQPGEGRMIMVKSR